jgi:hypothetical protein
MFAMPHDIQQLSIVDSNCLGISLKMVLQVGPKHVAGFIIIIIVIIYLLLFSLALQPSAAYGLLVSRGFLITHNEAPQSVGLL